MYITISVKKDILPVIKEAKNEFIRHHPEFVDTPISNHKIIKKALDYYIKH